MNMTIIHNTYLLRISIVSICLIVLTLLRYIHIIQLNSYNLDQNVIWMKKNAVFFLINNVLLIAAILFYIMNITPFYLVIVICLLGILIENLPRKQKKKLVFTSRIKRLILISAILFALFFLPIVINKKNSDAFYPILSVALAPYIVFLSYFISLPIENAFRKKYMNEAKKIIDENSLLYTIGITGSFGKTSVKYYLNTILKSKYGVCMTPESFNTAMGATLTIKNNLKNIDEIFICEMGARRVGDVKEICDIVSPRGAILTDVGNMHLDTFKNIENVRKCKFELIDAVYKRHKDTTEQNFVLVNGDNDLINEKIKEYDFREGNIYTYGISEKNDFYAHSIKSGVSGTVFNICCFSNDEKKKIDIEVETKLLGVYNIKNLVASVAYSLLLDVDILDIKKEVRMIEAVPHRLKLLTYDKDNLIIDDAYNSNPKGARNAVDALAGFDDYIKIIITPGMVELADRQDIENQDFASYAAKVVDFALVVGKTNKEALNNGFKTKLDKDSLICFDKVEEAIFYARNNIKGKKVILLENDLSDNY